mmetsp:Transcript_46092/g.87944  ORF Transcript_46092/g.87944 Transcript_46092/m.87944 type:complete len:221 (-) Transcript_46092:432-1094(-)
MNALLYIHAASIAKSCATRSPSRLISSCSRSGKSSLRIRSSLGVKKFLATTAGSSWRCTLSKARSSSSMSSSSARSCAVSRFSFFRWWYSSSKSVVSPKISCASASAYDVTPLMVGWRFFFFLPLRIRLPCSSTSSPSSTRKSSISSSSSSPRSSSSSCSSVAVGSSSSSSSSPKRERFSSAPLFAWSLELPSPLSAALRRRFLTCNGRLKSTLFSSSSS